MTTLSTPNFLPDYDNLLPNFDKENKLIPPHTYPQRNDALNVHTQFWRVLHRHFLKLNSISSEKAPSAVLKLQENSMMTCGFELLFTIIKLPSPQLGGEYVDLHEYVNQFKTSDGDPHLENCIRVMKRMDEATLQKDKTEQAHMLIRNFVQLLFIFHIILQTNGYRVQYIL